MTTTYICSVTSKSVEVAPNKRGAAPIPRGWKWHNGALYCAEAWRERWCMRAVTIPVHDVLDADWKEFAAALHSSWGQVTRLQNWMMTTLYASDCLQAPIGDDGKLPKWNKPYLYPQTGTIAPDVMSQNRAAIEQAVAAKYRSERFAIRARNNKSLPSYRYPQPLPIVSAAWNYVDGDRSLLNFPMCSKRWTIQLRRNSGSRRAMQALEQGVPTEMSLLARRVGQPVGQCVKITDAFGNSTRQQVMCKIALWMPRRPKSEYGTLFVRTDKDALLVALNAKDEKLWTYNGDHLRRLVAERVRRVQRLSDDRKYEQRQPDASFQARSTDEVTRYARKMATITHQIAASVIAYAERRHFAGLTYDDSDHAFVERFPWHELRQKIADKCEQRGVAFALAAAREPENMHK